MLRLEPTTPAHAVIDSHAVRSSHRHTVLREIWREDAVSRAEVARVTGFSRSTVSAIVGELIDYGLVRETRPGASRGGRRPIMLELQANARVMVGVEIGGGHVSCALVNLRGETLHHRSQIFPTREDPKGTQVLVERMIDEALSSMGHDLPPLLGIGLALPSPVQAGSSRILPLVMPAWEGVEIDEAIVHRYRVPVVAENDANAGIRAEARWGAARGVANAAFVKVATGIGCGFLLDDRFFSGHRGFAGELGHMSIDSAGPPCICGLNGCLNVMIGTPPLLERCRIRRARYPDSIIWQQELTVAHLVEAAKLRDPLACEVVAYAGSTLGIGIANVLNLLNLEKVVLGGRLTEAGDYLLNPLRDSLAQRALSPAVSETTVVLSELDHGVSLGAACLVLEAALEGSQISLFSKETSAA
ncbi:MAG: ROK family transcriptional regulator [Myxococcota bacterium]